MIFAMIFWPSRGKTKTKPEYNFDDLCSGLCSQKIEVSKIKFDCIATKIVAVKFWAKKHNSILNHIGKLRECGESICPLYILEDGAT